MTTAKKFLSQKEDSYYGRFQKELLIEYTQIHVQTSLKAECEKAGTKM